ncbi:MAG TPA: discoidin domain-containing protein, partial [Polyangiaceae bacterium]|nr:discoidin domain-containing protein [Polyangiaceae bacterium]
AGAGGSGGGSAVGCAAHPIPAKTTWVASANIEGVPCVAPETIYCGPSSYAIDGMTTTRFTTEAARTGTEWIQIDFGASVTVSKLVLHTAAGSNDYTHGYEVRMAAAAANIAASAAIVTGTGMVGDTTITFPSPQTGQFLRVNQTTAIAGWWSIQEIDASCQ